MHEGNVIEDNNQSNAWDAPIVHPLLEKAGEVCFDYVCMSGALGTTDKSEVELMLLLSGYVKVPSTKLSDYTKDQPKGIDRSYVWKKHLVPSGDTTDLRCPCGAPVELTEGYYAQCESGHIVSEGNVTRVYEQQQLKLKQVYSNIRNHFYKMFKEEQESKSTFSSGKVDGPAGFGSTGIGVFVGKTEPWVGQFIDSVTQPAANAEKDPHKSATVADVIKEQQKQQDAPCGCGNPFCHSANRCASCMNKASVILAALLPFLFV